MKIKLGARNLAVLGVLGMAACVGNNGGGPAGSGAPGSGPPGSVNPVGGSSGGTGSGSGAYGGSGPMCAQGASFAPARLSLISDDQYRNIVHDVFGVTFPASVTITTLPSTSGSYPYNENAQVQTTTVQAYRRAADQVAALMTSMPPCATGAVNATCIETFLRRTLPRAWRRPVTDPEIAGLITIFNAGATDGPTRQIQLTMDAVLLHPAFLYRSEIGTNAATATGKVQLTPYELSTALSFAVLNSSPDAELWARAQDGTLTQPAVLATEVTRMLKLPAVMANVTKKVSYYLDFETLPFISKDATAFPQFGTLQPALYQSAQMFLGDVMTSGHFTDLFTSRKIYANADIATAYGLSGVTGTQLQPIVTTGDMYNAGVLTQPALLAASNKNAIGDDVIHRGLWVYYNFVCAPPLPLPPGIDVNAVEATFMGGTRAQAQTRDTGCGASCHGHFDPFGLVTMNYDGIGRYRTTDPTSTPPNGPVDTTATVPAGVIAGTTAPVMLKGVTDVANLFVSARQVSDCAVNNLASYAMEHSPEREGSCDLQAVKDRFKQNGSFVDLFTAILTSPAFATRDIE